MSHQTATPQTATAQTATPQTATPTAEAQDLNGPQPGDLVEADVLVEDVSIDGMCGVY